MPAGNGATTVDTDAIRSEIIESAVMAIAQTLPQLVEAARADSISKVVRDREGRIEGIKTKYAPLR